MADAERDVRTHPTPAQIGQRHREQVNIIEVHRKGKAQEPKLPPRESSDSAKACDGHTSESRKRAMRIQRPRTIERRPQGRMAKQASQANFFKLPITSS